MYIKQFALLPAPAGNVEGTTTWCSGPFSIAAKCLPLRFKFVANGHRSSPNTRPLIWDSQSRLVQEKDIPADG